MYRRSSFDLKKIKKDKLSVRFSQNLEKLINVVNKKYLIAFSGGSDSVTLLALMLTYVTDNKSIVVCYINHGIQKISRSELRFIKKICENNKIIFVKKTLNFKLKKNGDSIEEWARINRYKELNKISIYHNCNWILTGHHGNDQVETILMNFQNSAGIYGLKGILPIRNNILRPMLIFTKKEIDAFLKKHSIDYLSDKSNDDLKIPRNFIRTKIIEVWEENDGNLIQGFIRSSSFMLESHEGILFFIKKFIEDNDIIFFNGVVKLEKKIFSQFPLSIKFLFVQYLTNSFGIWRKSDYLIVQNFFESKRIGLIINLKKDIEILNDREVWFIRNKINLKFSIKIKINIPYYISGKSYLVSLVEKSDFKLKDGYEYLDWDLIKNKKLTLRTWRNGDKFLPLGMKKNKKISDFLIDLKIPRFLKDYQTVLLADDEIILLFGLRINHKFRVTNSTNNIVSIKCK